MAKKPERIIINCQNDTKERFQTFALLYDDQEAALRALLDKYRDGAEKIQRPAF
jgi:hypothetical protein